LRPRGEYIWVPVTENQDKAAEALLLETRNSCKILENCGEGAKFRRRKFRWDYDIKTAFN
jgi:hypothetical protein